MTDINRTKRINRQRRHARVRAKISGTATCPRVTVFKSNTFLYAQAVDDVARTTIAAVNDAHLKAVKGTKTERAAKVGAKLGEALKAKGITSAVFDVSGFKYHGRIKAVADAIREAGVTL